MTRPDPRQLPVIHEEADGPEHRLLTRDVGQVPDEVGLHHVRAGRLSPSSSWACASSLRTDKRPGARMLEARGDALPVIQTDRVVEPEREPVREAPVHRQLQRVERAPAVIVALRDRDSAAERPDEIGIGGHERRRARRRVRGRRRILGRRQERGPDVDRVDVHRLDRVVAVLADVPRQASPPTATPSARPR